MDNINIWFARNKDGDIVTIDKVNEDNRYEEYKCPICESKLISKLGDINKHHFAHKDASKCDSEAQVHFFVKNELIKQGYVFKVKLDDEIKEFVCKEVLIEQSYETEFGTYRPDITIITKNDETIYFEIANTNKKKIEEYLDIWVKLNNIVVEVETKELIDGNITNEFKALFYEGKCFNISKDENEYYELIGKVKLNKYKYPIEQVNKLSWLWKDINRYLLGELEISELSDLIQAIEDEELREIVVSILRKNKCTGIMEDYINYNVNNLKNIEISENCNISVDIPTKYCDKIYGYYDLKYLLIDYDKTFYDRVKFYSINEISKKTLKNIERYKKFIAVSNIIKEKYIEDEIKISFHEDSNIYLFYYTTFISNIKMDDEIDDIVTNIKNEINKVDKKKIKAQFEFNTLLNMCKNGEISLEALADNIKNNKYKEYVETTLKINKNILNDYLDFNIKKHTEILNNINSSISFKTELPRLIHDRIYEYFILSVYWDDSIILSNKIINYDTKNILYVLNYLNVFNYIKEKYNEYTIKYTSCRDNFELYKDSIKIFDYSLKEDIKNIYNKIDKQIYSRDNYIKDMQVLCNYINNNYKCICDANLNDYNTLLSFTYYFTNDVCRKYSLGIGRCVDYNSNTEYYIDHINRMIRNDYDEIVCEEINKIDSNVKTIQLNNRVYLTYDTGSVITEDYFVFNEYIEENTLNTIINFYYENIKISEKYNNIFKDYYITCKNIKNNYSIILLNNGIEIYYKEDSVFKSAYFNIDSIDNIINNKEFKLALIENVEDFENYNKIKELVDNLNHKYIKVNKQWRFKFNVRRNTIDIYESISNFFNSIQINEIKFQDIEKKISDKIRNYVYKMEE